jgi:hypothetical protein
MAEPAATSTAQTVSVPTVLPMRDLSDPQRRLIAALLAQRPKEKGPAASELPANPMPEVRRELAIPT